MIILLVEKVDIQRIKALLESVPGQMEIDSINLKNGYSLNLLKASFKLGVKLLSSKNKILFIISIS